MPQLHARKIIIAGNGAGKTTFAREYLPGEAGCPVFGKQRIPCTLGKSSLLPEKNRKVAPMALVKPHSHGNIYPKDWRSRLRAVFVNADLIAAGFSCPFSDPEAVQLPTVPDA